MSQGNTEKVNVPHAHPLSISFYRGVMLPILLWIAFTPWSAELDLTTSRAFYQAGAFASHSFWKGAYIYALAPGWLLAGAALSGFFLSFKQTFREWRTPCLYLILTLSIGSGLIIHAVLKDHWGRPRPRQVEEFGGKQSFRPYYAPNLNKQPEPSKSFASGHASMGFYFFALTLLGNIYRSRFLFWMGMSLAWGLGILLSLTRIAEGGHFLSDTLAAALIMWLVSWGLAFAFFRGKKG